LALKSTKATIVSAPALVPGSVSTALPAALATTALLAGLAVGWRGGSFATLSDPLARGQALASQAMTKIEVVAESDLAELLTLMRGYCDFYEVAPSDEALLAMSRALIADPAREGMQLLARDARGTAIAFATIFWMWSTASAARIGVMNDLFVAQGARGTGVADELIAACLERCRRHGAVSLNWQTALDNHRAQAVYERIGGRRSQWLDYELPVEEEAA
jgi:GNAT superfamily N-acetyltransferase